MQYLLYNPRNDILAVWTKFGDLGKIEVFNEEYEGENNFIAYPISFLKIWGWEILGELK